MTHTFISHRLQFAHNVLAKCRQTFECVTQDGLRKERLSEIDQAKSALVLMDQIFASNQGNRDRLRDTVVKYCLPMDLGETIEDALINAFEDAVSVLQALQGEAADIEMA